MGENPTAFQAEVQLYKELSLETGCSIILPFLKITFKLPCGRIC